MKAEIKPAQVAPAGHRTALFGLLPPVNGLAAADADSAIPALQRQQEREVRWTSAFLGVWTFIATGLLLLHGAAGMAWWAVALRLLLWPLAWLAGVQGVVMLLLLCLAWPLLRLRVVNHREVRWMMEAGAWIVFSALAAWLIGLPGWPGPLAGWAWLAITAAELCARAGLSLGNRG